MNEKFYFNSDEACTLAGTGRCCKDKHNVKIATIVDKESEMVAIDSADGMTTLKINFEPVGETLLHIHGQTKEWETELGCKWSKISEEIRNRHLRPTRDQFDHISDVASTKLSAHTHTDPDCPPLRHILEQGQVEDPIHKGTPQQ